MVIQHENATPARLRRFVPKLHGGERERRKVTMHPDVFSWVHESGRSEAMIKAKSASRTHFAQFVKGERIDDCLFMKRIEDRRKRNSMGHQVWAVSPRFIPQYRFFGLFVSQNWFLVCNKQSRDFLDGHDDRWHKELDKSLRIWHSLFTDLPYSGIELYDYISENAEHCDDRW
jgi:hypothetical protein